MAHFAKITDDGMVESVIVISNVDCGGGNFPESELVGQAFISSLGLAGLWLQTSYNANFRSHYAGIGFIYDKTTDSFVPSSLNK